MNPIHRSTLLVMIREELGGMRITMPDSQAAVELQGWLLENHKAYAKQDSITKAELIAWLAEADESQGIAEIASHNSRTGATITFNIWNFDGVGA